MSIFDNKEVGYSKTHMSRYIASWRNAGGIVNPFSEAFREWLLSEGCTEQEIWDISEIANCGKMELEMSAKKYVERQVEEFWMENS